MLIIIAVLLGLILATLLNREATTAVLHWFWVAIGLGVIYAAVCGAVVGLFLLLFRFALVPMMWVLGGFGVLMVVGVIAQITEAVAHVWRTGVAGIKQRWN